VWECVCVFVCARVCVCVCMYACVRVHVCTCVCVILEGLPHRCMNNPRIGVLAYSGRKCSHSVGAPSERRQRRLRRQQRQRRRRGMFISSIRCLLHIRTRNSQLALP
jgi:hypothetical protein